MTLHTRDGSAMPIGTVTFTTQDVGRYSFDVKIDYRRFQKFFLSMRQFKCVATQQPEGAPPS